MTMMITDDDVSPTPAAAAAAAVEHPAAGSNGDNSRAATIAKLSAQLKKLNEANGKYKNLLKLAKERIQQQEEELQSLRHDKVTLEERLKTEEKEAAGKIVLENDVNANNNNNTNDAEVNIVRVCQRIKLRSSSRSTSSSSSTSDGQQEEIWALLEMEIVPVDIADSSHQSYRKYKEWKRFDTEAALQDFIRRDTGEPLTLPPYSLSPDQSARIQQEASHEVAKVTEEYRRFRVRAELARKQADAHIRELQSNSVQSVARRIEQQSDNNSNRQHEMEEARRSAGGQVERLRAEMAAQEAHWKEAYDMLLAENKALKSTGSEALLAAQWRQRYEVLSKEKEELESKLNDKTSDQTDQGQKYEAKYRDLKESFRLYRKKAKEIFEAQQNGDASAAGAAALTKITSSSSADAKLSYLRNLMVNYFTSDQAVQDHMQTAIGTVLQFSPEEVQRIEKKRAENEAWF